MFWLYFISQKQFSQKGKLCERRTTKSEERILASERGSEANSIGAGHYRSVPRDDRRTQRHRRLSKQHNELCVNKKKQNRANGFFFVRILFHFAFFFSRILSTLDRELLKPSASVALHRYSSALGIFFSFGFLFILTKKHNFFSAVDILPPEADSSIQLMVSSKDSQKKITN